MLSGGNLNGHGMIRGGAHHQNGYGMAGAGNSVYGHVGRGHGLMRSVSGNELAMNYANTGVGSGYGMLGASAGYGASNGYGLMNNGRRHARNPFQINKAMSKQHIKPIKKADKDNKKQHVKKTEKKIKKKKSSKKSPKSTDVNETSEKEVAKKKMKKETKVKSEYKKEKKTKNSKVSAPTSNTEVTLG